MKHQHSSFVPGTLLVRWQKQMHELVKFLKTLTAPAWFCCLVAVFSFFLVIYAWLPLHDHSDRFLILNIIGAMGAGLIAFMSMAGHHIITWQYRKSAQPKISLPKVYWYVASASLIFFLCVFLGAVIFLPHGVDLGVTVNLRIASAFSLFFSLAALGHTQSAGLRAQALHSLPPN